jgi:hypothetical protein
MMQGLTGDDLFATVLLLRAVDDRVIMLLEGDSDCKVLDPHIDPAGARYIPGYGKGAVVKAIRLVDQANVKKVVGIIDSDLDRQRGTPHSSSNLITTEFHDLDAEIFFVESVTKRLVANVCDQEAVERYLSEVASSSVVELVTRIASDVGWLRLRNHSDELGLRIEGLPAAEAIDWSQGVVDRQALARIVISKSPNAAVRLDALLELWERELAEREVDVLVCNGHDLLAILAALARKKFSCNFGKKALAVMLHVGLSCSEFMETHVFRRVEDWAARHGAAVWNCRKTLNPC